MPVDQIANIDEAFLSAYEDAILVIEDIDSAKSAQKRNAENDSVVFPQVFRGNIGLEIEAASLSAILNSIDGITAKDGRVLVMTTNHKENIDPALLRPGRIDLDLEIGHITGESFRKFIRVFYQKECANKLRNEICVTGAQLQNEYVTNHLTYEQMMGKYVTG